MHKKEQFKKKEKRKSDIMPPFDCVPKEAAKTFFGDTFDLSARFAGFSGNNKISSDHIAQSKEKHIGATSANTAGKLMSSEFIEETQIIPTLTEIVQIGVAIPFHKSQEHSDELIPETDLDSHCHNASEVLGHTSSALFEQTLKSQEDSHKVSDQESSKLLPAALFLESGLSDKISEELSFYIEPIIKNLMERFSKELKSNIEKILPDLIEQSIISKINSFKR